MTQKKVRVLKPLVNENNLVGFNENNAIVTTSTSDDLLVPNNNTSTNNNYVTIEKPTMNDLIAPSTEDEVIVNDFLEPVGGEDELKQDDYVVPDNDEDELKQDDYVVPDNDEDELKQDDYVVPDNDEDELKQDDYIVPEQEEEPIILPETKNGFIYSFDEEIKGLPIKIQCTWANCFMQPVWDRGLCIRSYDAKILKSYNDTTNVIGTTTGNYYAPEAGKVWLEANLKFCDRMAIGWFRESDIWHAKNGEKDPYPADEKKKLNWLIWLSGGAYILKIIS